MFFDAHIEVTKGWLEPLLATIASDRSIIAVPHIDWISSKHMSFDASDYGEFVIFGWRLDLMW